MISQRIIYDGLKTIDGPQNFTMANSLLTAVRSSRRKYHEYLEKKRQRASEEEKQKTEKRKIELQLKEVEEKRKKLELQREKENVELETLKRALQEKKRRV